MVQKSQIGRKVALVLVVCVGIAPVRVSADPVRDANNKNRKTANQFDVTYVVSDSDLQNFRIEPPSILLIRSDSSEKFYQADYKKGRTYSNEPLAQKSEIVFKQVDPGYYRLIAVMEHKAADGFVTIPTSPQRLSKRSVLALDLPPLYKIRLEIEATKPMIPRADGFVIYVTNSAGYRNYIRLEKSEHDNKYFGEWDYLLAPQNYHLELTGIANGKPHLDLGKSSITALDVLRGSVIIKIPDR